MLWQRSGGARTDSLDLMMTRQEIGNYLGMTLESVSRHLSQFQRRGWIRLERRRVQVLNLTALQQLKTADETSSPAQRSLFQRRMGMTEQSLSRV
jgi:DNA-binding MarR family transcriptional regulator